MQLIQVEKDNNIIVKGIGVRNANGDVLVVANFKPEYYRKWFTKKYRLKYRLYTLKADQYDKFLVLEEINTFEKVCLYNEVNVYTRKMIDDYFRSNMLQSNRLWGKAKEFVQEHELSFLEMAVIDEMFVDGIAKENIVGVEVYDPKGNRFSFNLNDSSGISRFRKMIGQTIFMAELNVSKKLNQLFHTLTVATAN